jgi:hypothetical protein
MSLAMLIAMSSRENRAQNDRNDTLTLVWASSLLASFVCLVIDLRLCALIAAFGVFWILYVMNRHPESAD